LYHVFDFIGLIFFDFFVIQAMSIVQFSPKPKIVKKEGKNNLLIGHFKRNSPYGIIR